MLPEWWTILLAFVKFLVYLGMMGIMGSCATLLLLKGSKQGVAVNAHQSWQLITLSFSFRLSIVGFFASVAGFFIQTGYMAEQGLTGMFSPFMMEMMWRSQVGTIATIHAVIFVLFGLLAWFLLQKLKRGHGLVSFKILLGSSVIFLLPLAFTFSLTGHASQFVTFGEIQIAIHSLIGLTWVGSLYPLITACYLLNHSDLALIMKRYGNIAIVLVFILVTVGVVMLIQLLSSPSELFFSEYGLAFLSKLLAVALMLTLAAGHKLFWVPRLAHDESVRVKLLKSIKFESIIGLIILSVTASITTALSPNL
ncbi:copper resistance D family protein [Glaciecola sp. 1036]|uniref:copper resistance D family protein n=1 Tax=Alteromonadaceae TaxID=72275 RepID=UPI003D060FF7